MSNLLSILMISLLAILTYQDFKSKQISWFLIPLLFIGFVTIALLRVQAAELLTWFGVNLLIVLLNLVGVTIIISIKERKVTNIIDSYLGLGDVLFFVVLTVVFSPLNFMIFFLGSILITTLVYGGFILFNKNKRTLIPLAGTMSLLLVAAFFIEHFYPEFRFYHDIISIVE